MNSATNFNQKVNQKPALSTMAYQSNSKAYQNKGFMTGTA